MWEAHRQQVPLIGQRYAANLCLIQQAGAKIRFGIIIGHLTKDAAR
jgi:hypothetical protein